MVPSVLSLANWFDLQALILFGALTPIIIVPTVLRSSPIEAHGLSLRLMRTMLYIRVLIATANFLSLFYCVFWVWHKMLKYWISLTMIHVCGLLWKKIRQTAALPLFLKFIKNYDPANHRQKIV